MRPFSRKEGHKYERPERALFLIIKQMASARDALTATKQKINPCAVGEKPCACTLVIRL